MFSAATFVLSKNVFVNVLLVKNKRRILSNRIARNLGQTLTRDTTKTLKIEMVNQNCNLANVVLGTVINSIDMPNTQPARKKAQCVSRSLSVHAANGIKFYVFKASYPHKINLKISLCHKCF